MSGMSTGAYEPLTGCLYNLPLYPDQIMPFLAEVRIVPKLEHSLLFILLHEDEMASTLFYFTNNAPTMWAFQKFKAKMRYLPCFNQMRAIRAFKNIRNVWH